MTTTIEIKLQKELADFLEHYAKKLNRRQEEVIADAIKLLRAEWEMEQGYLEEKEEIHAFAESAVPLFSEVMDEPTEAR
jgi:predicted transcriptional regulator